MDISPRVLSRVSALVGVLFLSIPVLAQVPPPVDPEEVLSDHYTGRSYSPYAERGFALVPLWGDTHLHTTNSMDAGSFGNRLHPQDAYRFARGEQVESSSGIPVRLSRPLDWLVVADHSDNMGFFPDLLAGKPHIMKSEKGKEWHDRIKSGDGVKVAMEIIGLFANGEFPEDLMYWPNTQAYKTTWQRIMAAAEEFNDPGLFTAFIGYEWTSLVTGNNMHRVVIYRDDSDKASRVVPYTTYKPYGSTNPMDLWNWLESYEDRTGGDVLAIAHNGNLSNGIMFPLKAQFDGKRARLGIRGASGPAGSHCTRSPRSRATARPTPCCPRTTSSPTTRPGISATSTSCPPSRPMTCSPANMPGRRSSAASSSRSGSAPTPTSSA